MYKIMVYERLERNKKGIPTIFEYHNDFLNANANLQYLTTIFGKHYGFFITKDKLPVEE